MTRAYAGYPSTKMYQHEGRAAGPPPDFTAAGKPSMSAKKGVQQLIWGDEIDVLVQPANSAWLWVSGRGNEGWVRQETIQDTAVLEVSFIDVGQGDGCVVVFPDRRIMVIDAGQTQDLHHFL